MNNQRAAPLVGIGVAAMLLVGLTLPVTAGELPQGNTSEAVLSGRQLVGLVRNLYVQVANNVLLEATHAPKTMIPRDAVYFVDVEFPERLPDGTEAIRAQLVDRSDVQVGDIVEIRIAHKDNPNFFPVKEVTLVTELVAKSDSAMARKYARGIALAQSRVAPLQGMPQTNPGTGIIND